MNIKTTKNKRVCNFGVTSEFSKVLLKRAAEKLNPNKVNGAVSNFSKQFLNTFSTWAPSIGISDELRQYQMPLPVGVYDPVPDSAGLTRTQLENKLFDDALKSAIIEISQEREIPEVKGVATTFHFADEGEKTKEEGFWDSPGNLGLVSAGATGLISYLMADDKKKKSGKALQDAAIHAAIVGGGTYAGSHLLNKDAQKSVSPTATRTEAKVEPTTQVNSVPPPVQATTEAATTPEAKVEQVVPEADPVKTAEAEGDTQPTKTEVEIPNTSKKANDNSSSPATPKKDAGGESVDKKKEPVEPESNRLKALKAEKQAKKDKDAAEAKAKKDKKIAELNALKQKLELIGASSREIQRIGIEMGRKYNQRFSAPAKGFTNNISTIQEAKELRLRLLDLMRQDLYPLGVDLYHIRNDDKALEMFHDEDLQKWFGDKNYTYKSRETNPLNLQTISGKV